MITLRFRFLPTVTGFFVLAAPLSLVAQTFRSPDPVVRRMWQVGMQESQVERLGQTLIDSIGPRLSGTAGFTNAGKWLQQTYQRFGIPVREEKYGSWRGWETGTAHMQLTKPRVQNLEIELLAWSAPTPGGRAVDADVVVIPALADEAAATAWLRTIKGKFVLISPPEIMCRAPQELERYARASTVTAVNARRADTDRRSVV